MTLFAQSATLSHVGNKRELNEDAFYVSEQEGVWCVADGMGGYEAGEVASAMVVSAVAEAVGASSLQENVDAISSAIKHLNSEIVQQESEGNQPAMGCTVLVVLARDEQCACMWAGDSRLYLYRDHLLYQMSKDHSLVQELVDEGLLSEEEKQHHPKSHVITRAVGANAVLDLDQISFDLLPSDQLLLCSDGLYNELSADQITQVLESQQTVEAKAQTLLSEVLSGSARDNVTISVIELLG